MKITSRRGFTLIELLVVIAIIGILASIVLVSVNSARAKGADVKVISDVKQIRTQIESDFNGTQYVDLTNAGAPDQLYGGLDANAVGTSTLNPLLADVNSVGSIVNVVNEPNTGPVVGYAVYGRLTSSSTLWFCLDSTGNSNQQTLISNQFPCP